MKTLALTLLSLTLLTITSCTANPAKGTTPESPAVESQTIAEVAPNPTATPAQKMKSCICVKMWLPVCGSNKKTYGNSCEADCAGVKYTQGECKAKK